MTAPRIVVVGAGVVGLLSAHALAKRGAAVTVIDRAPGPAEGCSRANAGILAVGHASAWARPSAIGSILRGLAGREAALRVTKPMDPALWSWGLRFLGQCTAAAHASNTDKLQRLSRLSRELTRAVEADLDLTGALRHEGGLYLFRDAGQFAEHAASVAAAGRMAVLTVAELIAREPALAHLASGLAGGIFSPVDSVGDCRQFTLAVAEALARRFDVDFRYETSATGLERQGRRVTAVATDRGAIPADMVLLATGVATARLTRPLGFAPAIYPVKGYSGTWEIRDPSRIPRLPFVDETELLAVASYGTRLRVTAIAEFAGQDDTSLPPGRVALLRDYVARNFGDAVDADSAQFWSGQRPSTPAGAPFLGRVRKLDNLWINAGHGQLGWTMAAGCGDLIARAMCKEEPDLVAVSSTAPWLDAI